MRLSTSLALAALGLAASALPAAAGTLLVPQQFPTIQKALNAAKPYDTVLVSPKPKGGVYNEAVTISTPHVVLQGQGNPVIDGAGLGVVVPQPPPFQSYLAYPNGIDIRADHVAVRGLTVQNTGGGPFQDASGVNVGYFVPTGNFSGVEVSFSDIEISGVTARNNYIGITIAGYSGSNPYFYSNTSGAYLKGYQVVGNTLTGNTQTGASLNGASVLVAGNKFTGNGADGLDVTGIGVTVSGNEAGGNSFNGMQIINAAGTYDPAVNDPKNPNPAPTVTALNYLHDNGDIGISMTGTQTVSGNVVANSAYYGIYLIYADFSTVSGNFVSGTGVTGIYADYSNAFYGGDSGLKISFNQISGSGGDGIYFNETAGGMISYNNVTGNQGVGIHLSDYTSDYGDDDYAPTTVTQNRALKNTLYDARDDSSAPDGDAAATINVWTKNIFGTTDPAGLSK